MIDSMLQYFIVGVVGGLAIGFIVWLIVYGIAALKHVLSSMLS